MKLRILLTLSVMLAANLAWATDRYVGPTTAGSANCTSTGNRCLLATAVAASSAGDSIFMADGHYTGVNSMLNPASGKSGSAGNPITVSATNDGEVWIDGQGTNVPMHLDNSDYWVIEGINFSDAGTKDGLYHGPCDIGNGSSHNIFRRIVCWNAHDGVGSPGNNMPIHLYDFGTDYNLFEDCAAFGTGRKSISISQGPFYNTFRRCFAMWNYSTASGVGPSQTISAVYNSIGNIFENVIATRDEGISPPSPGGFGFLSMDRNDDPDAGADSKYLGSIAYLLGSQTAESANVGFLHGGRWVDYFEFKDVVAYVEPGTHTDWFGDLFQTWDNDAAASGNNRKVTNTTEIGFGSNYTINESQPNGWLLTNFHRAASVAAAYGAESLWVNDGTKGATICYRYVDGTLTATPLWPWPMNDRISAALVDAGRSSIDVTATLEGIFGTIPPECRSDAIPPETGEITVTGPTTGTNCVSGSTCSITWISDGITGNVDIKYLVGGQEYAIATVAYDSSPYVWTVNAPASSSAMIRIKQSTITDDGDAFTVLGTKAFFK